MYPIFAILKSLVVNFTESGLNCDTCASPDPGQMRLELCDCLINGEAIAGAQLIDFAVLDELIGPADADDWDAEPEAIESFNDCRAEAAAENVILEGDKGADTAGVALDDLEVDGLDEAGIDDGGGVAFDIQARSQLLSQRDHGTEAKDGYVGALGENFSFAYG